MIKVSKLLRLHGTEDYPAKFYYTPDGHCVGPFDSEEEMEEEIARYYEEVPELRSSFTTEDWS